MSDYLQALVERARGEARSVQPRIAPRLAPALPPELEIEVDVPATRAATGEPAAPPGAAPSGRIGLPASPATSRGRSRRREAPETVAPAQAAVQDRPPVSDRAVPAGARERLDTNEHPQQSRETTLIERELREVQAPPQRAEPVTVKAERVAEQPPRGPVLPESAPAPASLGQPGRAEPPPGAWMDEAAAIEAEPEAVVISIGRIELHAAASPPPQPALPRPRPAPRLSLDDYLRNRSGGRR